MGQKIVCGPGKDGSKQILLEATSPILFWKELVFREAEDTVQVGLPGRQAWVLALQSTPSDQTADSISSQPMQ